MSIACRNDYRHKAALPAHRQAQVASSGQAVSDFEQIEQCGVAIERLRQSGSELRTAALLSYFRTI